MAVDTRNPAERGLQTQVNELWAEIARLRTQIAGGTVAPTDHGGLTGLDGNDHPQYMRRNDVTVTSTSYSATVAGPDFIEVDDDTAGADVTIALPAAASSEGAIKWIKKLGTTANVIIDPDGSELVDGGATATLTIQNEAVIVRCNGTGWRIY